MALTPRLKASRPMRIVLSAPAVVSFVSVWKAAAIATAQLGAAAFFVAGITVPVFGPPAVWLVLAAALVGLGARAIDVESWALLMPGGTLARVQQAFGPRAGRAAAAASVLDRAVFAALAAVVAGHYLAPILAPRLSTTIAGAVAGQELATVIAVAVIGLLWMRARIGLPWPRDLAARLVWIGVAVVLTLLGMAAIELRHATRPLDALLAWPRPDSWSVTGAIATIVFWLSALGLALPVAGSGDSLASAAHEFAPPRLRALQRTRWLVGGLALVTVVGSTALFALLVPIGQQSAGASAPIAALAGQLPVPAWVQAVIVLAVSAAALVMLVPAAQMALTDAEGVLQRLSVEGALSSRFAEVHRRLGTPVRLIDMTAAATVAVVILAGGREEWLARAYAATLTASLVIKVAALIRLRRTAQPAPYRVPLNLGSARRPIPIGLALPALVGVVTVVATLASGEPTTLLAVLVLLAAVVMLPGVARRDELDAEGDDRPLDVLGAADVSPQQLQVRPGGILAPVRNPHMLDHVVAALRSAADRDVIVMTVRLVGADDDIAVQGPMQPTPQERHLFAEVTNVAERLGHPVHLVIVPARNVVDAIVATAIRLESTDVFVGESATLSADAQARLLGDAWEEAERPGAGTIRLVVAHRSSRTDTFHIGVHTPSLTPHDLDLIHRLWLDAVKAVGPHVHHHDVVRAALTQMEQQLTGPHRDEAIAAIRDVARPADELAGILRARDYARLRDLLRNRHAGEVAELLAGLSVEDQVVVFRVLPRKDAAAVFEYLAQEAMEALLKAMAQEDVAALLNNMAPDDRTQFLEELPAAATRQLLSLLTPAERSVAMTLLGYPERSVGRLMTPHYVAVRQHWTVQEVLEYVRNHGHDSETLNVIYVVDDNGLLIDDVPIRQFLLAPTDKRAIDLMDRRFVTLTATDDQDAAVAVFRQYDRSALPVTDTAGVLIGIVTIDDVLDVAEAAATREIQRIGGSEALDEPYMKIAFWSMVRKRAGWLTALFIGEMLTATAMGAFEAEISRAVILALFVPLIISSGGNSGSQASTLVIRALALGEVEIADWWRVMRRELMAGLALGAILGSIGFLRIAIWSTFSTIYGEHWLLVATTVSVSLVGVVLWGTMSGSLLPFLLRRLGFDPAASSAPFVATLVDVTGLVIYFSVALVVLRGTLL